MRETAYRLSIAPQLEAFRPEIEHACAFLESCHPLVRANATERVLHYGPDAPAGSVAVPAVLFPDGARADAAGLHPRREKIAAMTINGGLLPPATPAARSELRYDALGLIFLLLTRLEERDFPACDGYGRYPISATLIPPRDGRLYPWADLAAREIAAALIGHQEPPSRTRYAVKFTHDVDILRGYHWPFEPMCNAAGDVLKRQQPSAAAQRLKRAYFSGEPWPSFRRLMKLSERHGLQSCFYFMGPSYDPMDSPYAATMPDLLRAVVDEVRGRGHVAGFHPGFRTMSDPDEWRRQRQGLEEVAGTPVREGRQHVLRYDAAATPRIWSDAGMALDCTPAYPEVTGFRTGTCRPHHAYDLRARRSLPLKQLSTATMEFGLFGGRYRDLTIEQAIEESIWAVNLCREFGGTFTFLVHTGEQASKVWPWAHAVLEQTASGR